MLVQTESFCDKCRKEHKDVYLVEKFGITGINGGMGKSYIPYRYWRVKTHGLIPKFLVQVEKIFCPECGTETTKQVRRKYSMKVLKKMVKQRMYYVSYRVKDIPLHAYDINWTTNPPETISIAQKRFNGILYLVNPKIIIPSDVLMGNQKYKIPESYRVAGKSITAFLEQDSKDRFLIGCYATFYMRTIESRHIFNPSELSTK